MSSTAKTKPPAEFFTCLVLIISVCGVCASAVVALIPLKTTPYPDLFD